MSQITRIQKDIHMFEENKKHIPTSLTASQKKIIELAEQYYQDAQYYAQKNDKFTAFGCINYAHGLLDAILKY
ncbi:MAG: DUF357 domain-containing protein [Candidatus Thermoplasmatota archaeon]